MKAVHIKAMHVSLRQIGNSQGVVIPKPILALVGLSREAGVEMTVEGGTLILRKQKPSKPVVRKRAGKVRTGWAEAAKQIAKADDDRLVMGEFANAADLELVW